MCASLRREAPRAYGGAIESGHHVAEEAPAEVVAAPREVVR